MRWTLFLSNRLRSFVQYAAKSCRLINKEKSTRPYWHATVGFGCKFARIIARTLHASRQSWPLHHALHCRSACVYAVSLVAPSGCRRVRGFFIRMEAIRFECCWRGWLLKSLLIYTSADFARAWRLCHEPTAMLEEISTSLALRWRELYIKSSHVTAWHRLCWTGPPYIIGHWKSLVN